MIKTLYISLNLEDETEETIFDTVEIVWHGRVKINELINEE